jgi:GNAT superfamily N-acetyltransferase
MSGGKIDSDTTATIDGELIETLSATCRIQPMAVASELRLFNLLVDESRRDLAIFVAGRIVERIIRGLCRLHDVGHTDTVEALAKKLKSAGHLEIGLQSHALVINGLRNSVAHATITDLDYIREDTSSLDLRTVSSGLKVIIPWYVNSVLPLIREARSLRIIEKDRINKSHLLGAAELGRLCYSEQYHSDPERLWSWHEVNQDLFTLVEDLDLKRVVGCLTVLPLWDDAYSRVASGGVIDVNLSAEEIRRYDVMGFYKLYVASLIVHPAYRRSGVFKLLYESYVDKLLAFAREEIFVTEVLADAVTDDGRRLVKWMHMDKIADSHHQSTIHRLVLLPPTMRADSGSMMKLMRHYGSRYAELKELLESSSKE